MIFYIMKSQTRSNNRKNRKNVSIKRRRGGGVADILLGASRIRGQKYEHWLEQRLVLVYNDFDFVVKVKKIFGYDKTAIGSFDKNSVKAAFESRKPEDKKIIMMSNVKPQ